jgi:hypothetical protein
VILDSKYFTASQELTSQIAYLMTCVTATELQYFEGLEL